MTTGQRRRSSGRPVGRPPRLSREQVLSAAVGLADEEGLELVTMQRVAARLGVGTMTLYGYFDSKRALHDGMLEWVLAELPELPEPETPWRELLEHNANALRGCLIAHPGVVPLLWDPETTADSGWQELVSGIRSLTAHHLPLREATAAYFALINFVIGAIEWEVTHLHPDDGAAYAAEMRGTLARTAHQEQDLVFALPEEFTALTPREHFDLRLSFLLDGIERRIERTARASGAGQS